MANLSFSNPAWNPPARQSGQPALSFDAFDSSFSMWDSMTMGSAGLDMGRTVTAGNFNPAAGGVNTTQIDGGASFVDALSDFGKALLQGNGVDPERPSNSGATPVLFSREPERKGLDASQLAVFALVGVGVYLVFSSGSSGRG